jgi:hypothetical protein
MTFRCGLLQDALDESVQGHTLVGSIDDQTFMKIGIKAKIERALEGLFGRNRICGAHIEVIVNGSAEIFLKIINRLAFIGDVRRDGVRSCLDTLCATA